MTNTLPAANVNHARPADVHRRILDEAARLFLERGYHAMSMREIAQAVGVSKPALYYHFADKEALFMALLADSLGQASAVAAAARQAGPDCRTRISCLLSGVLALPEDQRSFIRAVGQEMGHLSPPARRSFEARYYVEFIGQIEAIVREAMARGELRRDDPARVTWVLLGMVYPFFTARTPADADVIVALVTSMFFDGLAAPGQ